MSLFECQGHEFTDRVFIFIGQLFLFLSSYGVGNRAAFSDSRSNFHTRVGYRTNVCRRRLASDLARASEGTPAQGALEDHHDRLPGSPRHRQLKLVALGTSQFPDGGPRRPVYSDKGWPRYSVVVFLDESSTPGHAVYRVGVARRPSAFAEWLAPISGDNPVKDAKEWKGQVVPACRHAQ
jgi:hypothetical protein